MARGWESKSVEAQQDDLERKRLEAKAAEQTPAERAREHLLLQRTRILSEMQHACNPRFRCQLEAALAHLDAELKKLP